MINTDKYNITNSRIINMVLPFYTRGRKISLLLEAIAHPLKSIHTTYKSWALERLIEASVTSQPMSIVWYLNHKFRKYFQNKNDSFQISTNSININSTIWYVEEQPLREGETPWMMENTSDSISSDANKLVTRNINEIDSNKSDVTIYAPKITDTTLFTGTMYENEIRKCVDKYLTVQGIKYDIVIN